MGLGCQIQGADSWKRSRDLKSRVDIFPGKAYYIADAGMGVLGWGLGFGVGVVGFGSGMWCFVFGVWCFGFGV